MTDPVAPNPFPGYRPFDVPDAAWYFGRELEARALEARLADARVLAVIGAPEVGKSSLVRAGVIPGLQQRDWRVAILRPGEDPIGNLARALGAPEALGLPPHDLERLLRSGSGGLADTLRTGGIAPGQDLLVVVDQLDELFRYQRCRELLGTAHDDARFVELLVDGDDREPRVRMLFTMRGDSIDACGAYPALLDAVQRESFALPAMTGEQLQRAIEAQVAAAGARISPGLVAAIGAAFEPARVPGQLPLIQHALMRTSEARTAPGDELTRRLYESTGGLSRALFMHADEVCDRDPRPELVDMVVRAITSFVDGEFVPRPASIGEIARMADTSVDEVEGVVGRLQAPGVTFLKPPATGTLGERSVVDVSYDSFGWLRRHRWAHMAVPVVTSSRERREKLPARGGPFWPFVHRYLWPALLAVSTLMVMALLLGRPTPSIPDRASVPSCPAGQTLVAGLDGTWECTDAPQPPCRAGQTLVAGLNGTWQCTDAPQPPCVAGQTLVADLNGTWRCTDVQQPRCPAGQTLVAGLDGTWECTDAPQPRCQPGQTLVAGADGRLACEDFPERRCGPGQTLVALPDGVLACSDAPPPRCRPGQTLVAGADGVLACSAAPPQRCPPGQTLVARPDGVLACSAAPPRRCPPGQTLVAGPNGALECGPFPVGPLPPSCDVGQVLVGVQDGRVLCLPVPLSPSIQFDNLPRAAPGFVYRLKDGWTDIEELDLRISITPPSRGGKTVRTVVEGFRTRKVLLDGTLDLEKETPFEDAPFGYTLKLSPEAGGWSAVIRRCWGKCPARP